MLQVICFLDVYSLRNDSMASIQLFSTWRYAFSNQVLLLIGKTTERIQSVKYCSAVIEEPRTYELGNFDADLKPFLKSRKYRLRSNFIQRDQNETPIIKCKNPKLNHYYQQTYNKFSKIPLASENWTSNKSVGDYFSINVYPKNYMEEKQKSRMSFEESDMNPQLINVLKDRGITIMSEIQEKAIPQILSGKNCLLAAETGCGKTLAFLLPIIEQILQWKKEMKPEYNAPFVLIITPSRELTDQIRDVIKWFMPLGINSLKTVGGSVRKKILNPPCKEIDVLVTTIGIITKLTSAGIFSLKNVRHVILDEADALLDDSFNEMTTRMLKRLNIRSRPSEVSWKGVQLTLVSATMPTSIVDILGEIIEIDHLEKITTFYLHHSMPHVIQKFLRLSRSVKPALLLKIAKAEYNRKAPFIIFCNGADTCQWMSAFLNESGISNISLHGEMSLRDRKGRFRKFQNEEEIVLICTSIASRGLDTKKVQHVLNYEFPLFIADYIHRCGRTGRLGSNIQGKVTNFITGKNEIELVQKIEKAVRMNCEFENVNPNIKRIINFHGASNFERTMSE